MQPGCPLFHFLERPGCLKALNNVDRLIPNVAHGFPTLPVDNRKNKDEKIPFPNTNPTLSLGMLYLNRLAMFFLCTFFFKKIIRKKNHLFLLMGTIWIPFPFIHWALPKTKLNLRTPSGPPNRVQKFCGDWNFSLAGAVLLTVRQTLAKLYIVG